MTQNKGYNVPNIVVPTIRDENVFRYFLNSWKEEFKGCHLIVVEDRPKKILGHLLGQYKDFTWTIYDWKDIDKDLKDKAWIIPRRSDCVRSYGYYKAWKNGASFIVTLDDDVTPNQSGHIQKFYENLFKRIYCDDSFFNTMKFKLPRGTYSNESKGCDVVHGCWLNVPDFSAEEQANDPKFRTDMLDFNLALVPKGVPFSMCGMNLAWRPEVTKDMYFGLQGGDNPVDRCGDIWAGYHIASKGWSVYSGEPFCHHNKASNVWANMKKEKNAECYSKAILGGYLDIVDFDYYIKMKEAREIWEGLFNHGME